MSLAAADHPSDPKALPAFALACQAELEAAPLTVQLRSLAVEKLKFELAQLRRAQFGRSSERITRRIEQLELEEPVAGNAEEVTQAEADARATPNPERAEAGRKPLPEHPPRQDVAHEPRGDGACTCPGCGAGAAKLGEEATEVACRAHWRRKVFAAPSFSRQPSTRAIDPRAKRFGALGGSVGRT